MRVNAVTAVLSLLLSGCAVVPVYTAVNQARPAGEGPSADAVKPTRATMDLGEADLAGGVFVGIAMSGGGARAANFSAATLLELEKLGFLRHAAAISSVSGSSLPAAYYGLYGRDRSRWNDAAVRARFLVDLQTHWLVWWFNPWNIARYWFTHFDRSDIMKGVFDAYVFDDGGPQKTFGDMGTGRPKILVNATSLPHVGRFVFTDAAFEALGSRLDRYPVSHAVMASGAFPGAFHNVTLRDFRRPGHYEHLFDGGPSDNLGVETLVDIVERLRPRACYLFVVDAYPYQVGKGERRGDTRSLLDFVVDQNVADSSDVFLTLRRYDTLRRLGLPRGVRAGQLPQWLHRGDGFECAVWHLTFQSLIERDSPPPTVPLEDRERLRRALELEKQVNLIPTRYRLEGLGLADADIQARLFEVARHLLREDGDTLRQACEWFRGHGLTACDAR